MYSTQEFGKLLARLSLPKSIIGSFRKYPSRNYWINFIDFKNTENRRITSVYKKFRKLEKHEYIEGLPDNYGQIKYPAKPWSTYF